MTREEIDKAATKCADDVIKLIKGLIGETPRYFNLRNNRQIMIDYFIRGAEWMQEQNGWKPIDELKTLKANVVVLKQRHPRGYNYELAYLFYTDKRWRRLGNDGSLLNVDFSDYEEFKYID